MKYMYTTVMNVLSFSQSYRYTLITVLRAPHEDKQPKFSVRLSKREKRFLFLSDVHKHMHTHKAGGYCTLTVHRCLGSFSYPEILLFFCVLADANLEAYGG